MGLVLLQLESRLCSAEQSILSQLCFCVSVLLDGVHNSGSIRQWLTKGREAHVQSSRPSEMEPQVISNNDAVQASAAVLVLPFVGRDFRQQR